MIRKPCLERVRMMELKTGERRRGEQLSQLRWTQLLVYSVGGVDVGRYGQAAASINLAHEVQHRSLRPLLCRRTGLQLEVGWI